MAMPYLLGPIMDPPREVPLEAFNSPSCNALLPKSAHCLMWHTVASVCHPSWRKVIRVT